MDGTLWKAEAGSFHPLDSNLAFSATLNNQASDCLWHIAFG
jgi:hypothetical protein